METTPGGHYITADGRHVNADGKPFVTTPEPEFSQYGDDLTAIKGIGPSRAEELAVMGVTTYMVLAAEDAEALAEGLGVSEETAVSWIEAARELTGQDDA